MITLDFIKSYKKTVRFMVLYRELVGYHYIQKSYRRSSIEKRVLISIRGKNLLINSILYYYKTYKKYNVAEFEGAGSTPTTSTFLYVFKIKKYLSFLIGELHFINVRNNPFIFTFTTT